MNPVALVCVTVLGLLLFGLGLAVSALRGRRRMLHGHPADPADLLHKVVRAQANTAEYAPMLAVLMLTLGSQQPAPWVLWAMALTTACRVLIVAGLVLGPTMARPHPLRFIGALGTYLGGVALCLALVFTLFTGP